MSISVSHKHVFSVLRMAVLFVNLPFYPTSIYKQIHDDDGVMSDINEMVESRLCAICVLTVSLL